MTRNRNDRVDLERGRASDPLVRAAALHHIVLESPAPGEAERFYGDLGLVPSARTDTAVYLRGRGTAHHVLELVRGPRARLASIAMSVDSELDLRRLASLPNASIEPITEPGGGKRVRLEAPGGLIVDAVHDVAEVAPLPARGSLPANVTGEITRAGRPVRLPPAPSEILRLGHVAFETPEPSSLVLWLLRTMGMIVSDYQPLEESPSAPPIVSFLRCDRGALPSDHHTLAVALGPRSALAHVAFEVRDLDEIGRGSAFLRSQGHPRAWGIGRHILGSQLFDYFRAPDGIVVERYCDGDVFDASVPTGRLPFRGSNLAQWGEPPPLDFALPPFSFASAFEAASGVASSDELSVALLTQVARDLSR